MLTSAVALGQSGIPQMFVGSSHVWTQMHCDVTSSTFIMVEGQKRWLLFPPTETLYMAPYGHHRNVAFNTEFDVFHPDLESHPAFAKARGFEVVLEPGDVLFFPSFWWHAVQNKDAVTVCIDIALIDPWGSWRRNSMLTIATLLNPNIIWDLVKVISTGQTVRELSFRGYRSDNASNPINASLIQE